MHLHKPRRNKIFKYGKIFNALTPKGSKNKYLVIGLGDISAQAGSCHVSFLEKISKFGKGNQNINDEFLLDNPKENDLMLSHTRFDYMPTIRKTWA